MSNSGDHDHDAGLRAFLEPRGIAVFGVSAGNPTAFGSLALQNLLDAGYDGELVVVHPSSDNVRGVRAVRELSAAGHSIDLAIIAVRAEAVPAAVEQCAAAGVRAVTVVGSGFAEAGTADAVTRQRRIVDIARGAGMRLLGPNTVGAAGFTHGAVSAATANIPPGIVLGTVAVVSQSGGLGTTILATAQRYGVGLQSFVALGNEADISAADAIVDAVERGASAVLCYLETLRDPAAFADAARLARTRRVPIVLLKGGTEAAGQAIAASHTASLAGSMRVMDAVLADLSVTRVSSIEALVCAGALFGAFGPPPGPRLGVLGLGGGNCALLADALERGGLELATLTPDTSTRLVQMLPDSNGANPFDPGGWFLGRNPHLLEQALREVAADPGVDVMVFGMVPLSRVREEVYVPAIAAVAKTCGRPGISLSMHTPTTDYRTTAYLDSGVLELSCTDAATEALRVWLSHAPGSVAGTAVRDVEEIQDAPGPQPGPAAPGSALRRLHVELASGEEIVLLEDRAIELLTDLGLQFPHTAVGDADAELAPLAAEVGFPLVVKAIADGLLHRAQAGAVALDVAPDTLADAAARVLGNARKAVGPGTPVRLLLQRQSSPGTELIVGVQRDPVFGPVVMLGLGGVWSELLDDVCFALPPLNPSTARRMLTQLRGYPYLRRAHAAGEFDEDALVYLVLRVGAVAERLREYIVSLDLNPVIVTGSGVSVVDALLVVRDLSPRTPSRGQQA